MNTTKLFALATFVGSAVLGPRVLPSGQPAVGNTGSKGDLVKPKPTPKPQPKPKPQPTNAKHSA